MASVMKELMKKFISFCRKREKQAPSNLANPQTFIAFKTDPDGQFPDNLRSRNSNCNPGWS